MAGGNRVVSIYADRLARRGYDVVVVAGAFRRISPWAKLKSLLAGRGWPKAPEREPSYFSSLPVEFRKLKTVRPVVDADVPDADVVIATWWETAEWVNALSAQKGAKVYFIQHHEVFPHLPVERCHATYRLPFQKVVISRWLLKIMKQQYGDDNVILIPNSVDTAQFYAPDRGKQPRPTVGFVYAKVGFKGADVILRALAEVRQQLPELRVVAFGGEHPSPDIPLPEWIEYHYRPPQDQIRHLYGACDVWLCGSRSEGFYLPMLEAMACRCPVVSTKVGGPIDHIKDAVNGFLVDIDDATALAERALNVLRLSEDDWHRMSAAALSTATQYTWDDATDRLEQVLRPLTAQKMAARI
jgi:glycosyltransferase involved in cell wall biosynthesis